MSDRTFDIFHSCNEICFGEITDAFVYAICAIFESRQLNCEACRYNLMIFTAHFELYTDYQSVQ